MKPNCRLRGTRIIILSLGLLGAFPAFATRDGAILEVFEGNKDYLAGKYEEARVHYAAAISQDSTWAVAWNNRGLARMHQHPPDLPGAEADLLEAKRLEPSRIPTYLNLAKCLAAESQYNRAIGELQIALTAEPTNYKLLYNLAWVYDAIGDYPNAIVKYDQALQYRPGFEKALLGRAISFANQHTTSTAVDQFYGIINTATEPLTRQMAAYNLQLLRGPGVPFHNAAAATMYADAMKYLSAGIYSGTPSLFDAAFSGENDVAEIPWMKAICLVLDRDPSGTPANSLAQSINLMASLPVQCNAPAVVYLDGLTRGATPIVLRTFRSRFDLTARAFNNSLTHTTAQDFETPGYSYSRVNRVAIPGSIVLGKKSGSSQYWTSGSITSCVITPSLWRGWGTISFTGIMPARTRINCDILPESGTSPIGSFQNLESGANISAIDTGAIRIRLKLMTDDPGVTPVLNDWTVTWADSSGLIEQSVVVYTDATPGGQVPISLYPRARSVAGVFAPQPDSDRDWLGDDWEIFAFGNLAHSPQRREDSSGLNNLEKYWRWESIVAAVQQWRFFR